MLKATQILMVIASPVYHQWIYLPNYAMPDFITYFTKIIPLTPYLEALKIMVVEKVQIFNQKIFLALIYFRLGLFPF